MTFTKEQRAYKALTAAQQAALIWLHRRGGSAVRMKWPRHTMIMTSGEISPYMAATYKNLIKHELCTYDRAIKRFELTRYGKDVAAQHIASVRTTSVAGPTQTRGFDPIKFDRVDEGGGP